MKTYCFLVPNRKEELIRKYYLKDIKEEDCLFIPLYFEKGKKKTRVKDMKSFLEEEVFKRVKEEECKYLFVCNGEYFKCITKVGKVDPYLGYVLPIDGLNVLYVPSYEGALYHEDTIKHKIGIALNAALAHSEGHYKEPGKSIINTAIFPQSASEIEIVSLHHCDKLTCDIETWSLKHYDAGITSITFCWNEHEGTVFRVDFSKNQRNEEVRELLREFFEEYKGTLIFHNITFDMYILTYQLYMKDLLDTEGLLRGLEVLLKNFEDTKIIAYLATNSCTGNNLSLKALSQEFAGNYGQEEISNIDAIPEEELLRYNLIDGLSAWYVFNKYYPIMIQDEQERIYKELFKPAVKDIIQMQLTGLPLDMKRVLEVEKELEGYKDNALDRIYKSVYVQEYMEKYKKEWVKRKNEEYKKKRVSIEDCKEIFNPNSNIMLKELIYEDLGLPQIEFTTNKEPATGKDVLAKLILHTENQGVKDLLQALIDYKDVIKILTAFIPAFKQAVLASDGRHYLFGSQNSTGTVSGRYSSSSPNMAQMPSTGSKFAKIVKSCFTPPKGTLFVGIDFNALEAKIDALLTHDKNKLAIYEHGYDSHMFFAMHYWTKFFKEFPLIEDDLSRSGFKCIIDGVEYFITEGEEVELPSGKIVPIEEAYLLLSSKS